MTYDGNAAAEYEVSFKVRFTNTTFRTADADVKLVLQSGGPIQGAYYEAPRPFPSPSYRLPEPRLAGRA